MATHTSSRVSKNPAIQTGSQKLNVEAYLPNQQLPIHTLSCDAVLPYLMMQPSKKASLLDSSRAASLPAITPLLAPEAQSFLKVLAAHAEKSSASAYPISRGAGSTEDVVADISYFGRTLAGFGADSPVYQAIGVTTSENVFMGFYAAFKACDRYQKALRIGDFGGKVDGSLDALRGATQGIGGGFYLGYRGTMIASEINNVNTTMAATTALGKVTFAIGVVGNFFFGLFYLFMGIWGGYHLYRSSKFLHGMNKVDSAVPFFFAQAYADTHEKLSKLRDAGQLRQASFKRDLRNKCLNEFADQLLIFQNQLVKDRNFEGKELNRSEMKKAVAALFDAIDTDEAAKAVYLQDYCKKMGLNSAEVDFLGFSSMEICGLKLEEQHRKTRKEVRFERAVGADALEKVKDAYKKGLAERLASHDPNVQAIALAEAEQLEKTVRSALIKNLVMFSTFVLIGILGVVVSTATIGLFALPPGWALAMTILSIVLVVAMAGIDIYFWKTGLESGAPGKHDKWFVGIIATVLAISIVVAIALTFIYGLPLMPLIFTLIMGIAGLGVCGYTFVKMNQHEKKCKEDHPDLERIENILPADDAADVELDECTRELFKKLSKADRQAVRAEYFRQSSQLHFKKHEYTQLDITADFGGAYVDRAISLEANAAHAQYNILERAAKKTVKVYWEKWHRMRSELDKQQALKIHRFMELLTMQRRDPLRAQLSSIKENTELYNTFKANIYYLCKREESAQDLKTVVHAVRTADKTGDPTFDNTQLKRVQEIYDHTASSAA